MTTGGSLRTSQIHHEVTIWDRNAAVKLGINKRQASTTTTTMTTMTGKRSTRNFTTNATRDLYPRRNLHQGSLHKFSIPLCKKIEIKCNVKCTNTNTLTLTPSLTLGGSAGSASGPASRAPKGAKNFGVWLPNQTKNKNEKIKLSNKRVFYYYTTLRTSNKRKHSTLNPNVSYYIILKLSKSGDIEKNPGPQEALNDSLTTEIITLNCRGLTDRNKTRSLISNILKITGNDILIVFLQETLIDSQDYLNLIWKHQIVFTPGNGHSKGCITLTKGLEIDNSEQLEENRGHIINTKKPSGGKLKLLNIYAPNGMGYNKKLFFKNMFKHTEEDIDTIIGGDLNITLYDSERINTTRTREEKAIGELVKSLIKQNNLNDIWNPFDTQMTRKSAEKMSRLDRILYKGNMLLSRVALDWAMTTSDHCAVRAIFDSDKKTRPFHKITVNKRYYNSKQKKKQFKERVEQKMELLNTEHQTWSPELKLEYFKLIIRTDYEDTMRQVEKFRNIELKIRKEEHDLLQEKAELNQCNENELHRLSIVKMEIEKLIETKGKINAEKLKLKWVEEGEKSNKYFLNLTKSKANNARIKKLTKEEGTAITNKEAIAKEIQNFYKKLYEETDEISQTKLETFLSYLKPLEQEHIEYLNQVPTKTELMSVLRSCPDSAPGPDGITYSIYKIHWHQAQKLILENWTNLLKTQKVPPSWKSNTLTLLKKQNKDANKLQNWRPITLSNCDFKLMTKLLAKRLTNVLTNTIGYHQTAYMPGRSISDNLRLLKAAYDTAETQNKKLIVIGLDAQKAFDSVSHITIIKMLKHLGLEDFAQVFQTLYEKQKVTIINGGEEAGHYTIKKGVKQGDSLSCIIFIAVMEMLLKKLNDLDIEKFEHKGMTWPTAIGYADDITIIMRNEQDIQKIFDVYEDFRKATGLRLNADKTELHGLNHNLDQIKVRYDSKDITITPINKIKINGLTFHGLEKETYTYNWTLVLEKIRAQLEAWVPRKLTILGKIQTIKTFGLSQCLYLARVIPPKEKTVKQINNLINHYIWSRNLKGNRAPQRIKQRIMEKPIDKGGFGLTSIKEIIERMNYTQIEINIHQPGLTSRLNTWMSNVESIAPKPNKNADSIIRNHAKLKTEIWLNKIEEETISNETKKAIEKILKNTKATDILETNHTEGIYFFLWTKQRKMAAELTHKEILSKIKKAYRKPLMELTENNRIAATEIEDEKINTKRLKGTLKKECKNVQQDWEQEVVFKSGLILDQHSSKRLFKKIKKITSSWAKALILRFIHGDQKYNSKLFKSNYADSPMCDSCDEIETFEHCYITCKRLKPVNDYLNTMTTKNWTSLIEALEDYEIKPKQLTIIAYLVRHIEDFKTQKIEVARYMEKIVAFINQIK